MSATITCPICGRRNIYEFRFGGEDRGPRPFDDQATAQQWYAYVHLRTNTAGPQQEWWYHRDGCGTWFTTWRDVTLDCEVEAKEGNNE
jgi:sarcosine oxidase subunit delta